jgi:hypothetical protein
VNKEKKMGILEKIAEIEKEINRTQKNKGIRIHQFGSSKQGIYSHRVPSGNAQGQVGSVSSGTTGDQDWLWWWQGKKYSN